MTNVIKEIRKIISEFNSNWITIHIADDEIWIDIYETEVPLVIDLKHKEVYVDCESSCHKLSSSMLNELSKICELLENNLNAIEDLLKLE